MFGDITSKCSNSLMAAGKGLGEKFKWICGASMCCFIVLGLVGLGIARIVMGSVYIHDCPLKPMIPIWLIVSAVATIFFNHMARRSSDDSDQININCSRYICYAVGEVFNLAWVICGSIWVYPNFGKIRADDFIPCSGNISANCTADCHRPLMYFSVAMVTMDWIVNGLAVVCFGLMIRACVSK